jgi:hypothetical protein
MLYPIAVVASNSAFRWFGSPLYQRKLFILNSVSKNIIVNVIIVAGSSCALSPVCQCFPSASEVAGTETYRNMFGFKENDQRNMV